VFRRTAGFCVERPAIGGTSLIFKPETPPEHSWNINETRDFLERAWTEALRQVSSAPVTEMMRYALTGGKCLRGLLLLAVTESCNGSMADACRAAISIEMLHAASLVVDDLPALDNASVRRNAPSLHSRFGERAGILTAHALVAAAFQVISEIPDEPERVLRITGLLAAAIGRMANGELLGPVQWDPAESIASKARVRALKTGALFELAASIGALLAGAGPALTADLAKLGLHLGVCYQVADDLRDDVMSDHERDWLFKENLRNWRDCDRLLHSLRSRLTRQAPLEEWMSEFRTAGSEAGLP